MAMSEEEKIARREEAKRLRAEERAKEEARLAEKGLSIAGQRRYKLRMQRRGLIIERLRFAYQGAKQGMRSHAWLLDELKSVRANEHIIKAYKTMTVYDLGYLAAVEDELRRRLYDDIVWILWHDGSFKLSADIPDGTWHMCKGGAHVWKQDHSKIFCQAKHAIAVKSMINGRHVETRNFCAVHAALAQELSPPNEERSYSTSPSV